MGTKSKEFEIRCNTFAGQLWKRVKNYNLYRMLDVIKMRWSDCSSNVCNNFNGRRCLACRGCGRGTGPVSLAVMICDPNAVCPLKYWSGESLVDEAVEAVIQEPDTVDMTVTVEQKVESLETMYVVPSSTEQDQDGGCPVVCGAVDVLETDQISDKGTGQPCGPSSLDEVQ